MKREPSVQLNVGLSFGDEGKGTITDFLCRQTDADLVVRYNGGAQAAHAVVTDDGRQHVFAQIGSGSFLPQVRTLLSRFMLVDPVSLANEVSSFSPKVGANILDGHYIDCRAPIITPFHVAANRLKEWSRGGGRHGSCGAGVGETAYDLVYHADEVIHAGDLTDINRTKKLLVAIQDRKRQELVDQGINLADQAIPEFLSGGVRILSATDEPGKIAEVFGQMADHYQIIEAEEANRMIRQSVSVFEGAQGVLLDEWYGFHPYTTWSTTTLANAEALLDEAHFEGSVVRTGILRSYTTRHGPGPFVTEDEELTTKLPDSTNGTNEWQRSFRIGWLDLVMLRYALDVVGQIDQLAVTNIDRLDQVDKIRYCAGYEHRYGREAFDQFAMTVDRGRLERLIWNDNRDLTYQRDLGQFLEGCRPVYCEANSTKKLLEVIESELHVPIGILSYGPTAGGKRYIPLQD